MDDDTRKTELARRAVACKHWRWMPGMSDMDGCRVVTTDGGLRLTNPCLDDIAYLSTESLAPDRHPGCSPVDLPLGDMPDLGDPATLGCLIALAREAWDNPRLFVGWGDGGWRVLGATLDPACNTEAEALVAALEAAP